MGILKGWKVTNFYYFCERILIVVENDGTD